MKKTDKIIINVTAYGIILLETFLAVKNLAAAFFIAFLIWITLNKITVHFINRHKIKSKLSVAKLEELMALMGISGQVEYFCRAIPPCFNPSPFDCGLQITLNCEKILIFPAYKFSACSLDEIAKFYRCAKSAGADTAWVLSRQNSRAVVLFANDLDINFEFKPTRAVRKFLNDRNMLPSMPQKKKKVSKKTDFKAVINGIIDKKRAKYFFPAGLFIIALGLLTPMKIYYAVAGAVCGILGTVCLLKGSY